MYNVKPCFYDQFQCTASQCSDTCCTGWDIMIDEDSLRRYRLGTSPVCCEASQHITVTEERASFRMAPNGYCHLLTENHLCRLVLEEGEEALCQICRDHPRFFAEIGEYDQAGVGLCCEVSSKLLLDLDKPLTFVVEEDDREGDLDFAVEILHGMEEVLREIGFDNSLSPQEKWAEILEIATATENQLCLEPGEPCKNQMPDTRLAQWEQLLVVMEDMIPIHQTWTNYLMELRKNLPNLVKVEADYVASPDYNRLQYGNIFAYLLYRHLPGAMWDGQLVARVKFVRWGLEFVHLSYLHYWKACGALPQSVKIDHLKNWSKQVEYCDENVEMMITYFI